MLARTGNLREIYAEALRNADIVAARQGSFAGEIVADCVPRWHLIRTAPSRESTAAARLAQRRMGTYLPTFGRYDVVLFNGEARAGTPLFPGYLFVFVWNIQMHWRRISNCPGVIGVVLDAECPVVVPDRVIDDIQILEVRVRALDDTCRPGRRGWRRRRRPAVPQEHTTVTISTASWLTDIDLLDESGRNSALHRALGLASNASAPI